MFIQNAVLKSINAEGLSFPLAEGSVVSAGGVTGIVPTTLNVRPATNRIYVAVAGTVDLTSDANKGVTFTDEQIKALGGDFNFVPAMETASGVPTVVNFGPVDGSDGYAADIAWNDMDFTNPVVFRLNHDDAVWQSTNYYTNSNNGVYVKFDFISNAGLIFAAVVWEDDESVTITEYETQIAPVV